MSSSDVSVKMGEVSVGEAPTILAAPSLGSCVAVCLYDPEKKKGGLAHVVLPGKTPAAEIASTINSSIVQTAQEQDLRYSDMALAKLIQDLRKLGLQPADLQAKLVGGAEMFSILRKSKMSLGEQNAQSIKEILEQLQISVVSEDLGGNAGRTVRFFLESGDVEVRKRM